MLDNRVILKVRKAQHENPEFWWSYKTPANKCISVKGGRKLRKASILAVN
jgi:hypothetical protein